MWSAALVQAKLCTQNPKWEEASAESGDGRFSRPPTTVTKPVSTPPAMSLSSRAGSKKLEPSFSALACLGGLAKNLHLLACSWSGDRSALASNSKVSKFCRSVSTSRQSRAP